MIPIIIIIITIMTTTTTMVMGYDCYSRRQLFST